MSSPNTKSWSIFWGEVGDFGEGKKGAGMGQHGCRIMEVPTKRDQFPCLDRKGGKEMSVGINS